MIRRGFTVVELIITITIMGILLTLAVVNLTATQANARDNERKSDVEALALNLENYYNNQDPNNFMSGGTYPGVGYMNDAEIKTIMPDINMKSAYAPDTDENGPISVRPATTAVTTTTGILPLPTKTNDIYVYQALTSTGGLCSDPFIDGDCRRFNIYYYEETTSTVKLLTSKHQ